MTQASKLAENAPFTYVLDVRRAMELNQELSRLLKSLGQAEALSETRSALARAGFELDGLRLKKFLERALDELDAVPPTRIDTDRIPVSHGTIKCFEFWSELKRDGRVPRAQGRTTGDDYHLIDRFMKEHPNLELSMHSVPFGGSGESFSIRGEKQAREKFENDPRWPRLQEALDDIYWTDHSAGYSDEIRNRKRKLPDPMAHVFGGGD